MSVRYRKETWQKGGRVIRGTDEAGYAVVEEGSNDKQRCGNVYKMRAVVRRKVTTSSRNGPLKASEMSQIAQTWPHFTIETARAPSDVILGVENILEGVTFKVLNMPSRAIIQ
jgi:hypothetical protein